MSLSTILSEIDNLQKQLISLTPQHKEISNKLWQKFRFEWDFNSNHIEGNTLTYGETQLLLIFDRTTGEHDFRELEEMKAHDSAVHLIKDWSQNPSHELSETDIRSLNQMILVRPYWKEAITSDGQPTRRQIKVGEYKSYPNSVRLKNGELFHYTSPEETPRLMSELINWYRSSDDIHPVIKAAEIHYRFIRIHPFDDGNGRVARLLVNFILMKAGYPPIVIKRDEKDAYLSALQKADTGNREAFHHYIAEQLIWSITIAIKAYRGEDIGYPPGV